MAGVRRKRTQKKKRVNSTLTGRKLKKKNKIKVNINSKVIRKAWNESKTVKENFKGLGLMYNANNNKPAGQHPRTGSILSSSDENGMEIDEQTKNNVIQKLEEEASHGMKRETHVSPGEAKFLWELIRAHGSNYEAMTRDKRNYYQHTAKQLKRKCTKFLNSSQDFSKYVGNTQ